MNERMCKHTAVMLGSETERTKEAMKNRITGKDETCEILPRNESKVIIDINTQKNLSERITKETVRSAEGSSMCNCVPGRRKIIVTGNSEFQRR